MIRKAIFTVSLLAMTFGGQNALAAEMNGDAVSKGKAIYNQRCLHCHGENADGKGHLIEFLKVVPADLTKLRSQKGGCVTERVLKAVLGRHTTASQKHNMPLLKEYLSPEDIYFVSEYIKTLQK